MPSNWFTHGVLLCQRPLSATRSGNIPSEVDEIQGTEHGVFLEVVVSPVCSTPDT